MIELKDILKVYKTKHGNSVVALDQLNLTFDEKGMVFILGKSGSGKSTFLNILGGLDYSDEGEMIIDGQSSKTFSPADYDAYRNTYVGFIFQEYNLLDNLSIEDNIAIALELKGDVVDSEKIKGLLKQVDLEGFANRMPNELSTGQKQRVAIARALIKNPKMILADEPTGALDSTTSHQVLKELKRLSMDRLVIVVTHDGEFAETYGDRIINISDGKIVSDRVVQTIENATHQDRLKLVKSKIPLKFSIKLSFIYLKLKPLRLSFTIFLSAVAFILFGLTDTFVSFDKSRTTVSSLYASNIPYLTIGKQKQQVESTEEMRLSDFDLERFNDKFSNHEFIPVVNTFEGSIRHHFYDEDDYYFYNYTVNGTIGINESSLKKLGFTLVSGRLPNKDEEVAISFYFYRLFNEFGYFDGGKPTEIHSPQDLIGKSLILNNHHLKITGIIDTNFNEERYERFKQIEGLGFTSDFGNQILRNELSTLFEYGLHHVLFIDDSYYADRMQGTLKVGDYLHYEDPVIEFLWEKNLSPLKVNDFALFDVAPEHIIWKDGIEKSSLSKNEIIISIDHFPSKFLPTMGYDRLLSKYENELIDQFVAEHFHEIEDQFMINYPEGDQSTYAYYIRTSVVNNYHQNRTKSYFETQAKEEILKEYLKSIEESYQLSTMSLTKEERNTYDLTIVGAYVSMDYREEDIQPMIVSNDLFRELNDHYGGNINYIVSPLQMVMKEDLPLVRFTEKTQGGEVTYLVYNEVSSTLNQVEGLLSTLSIFSFYIGLVLVLFAALLLFNFMHSSILHRKKEVGILRALGASRRDVFHIFYSESLLIAFINFLIATVTTLTLSIVVNHMLRDNYQVLIKLLYFSIRQVVILFVVSIFVATISSILPIYHFSNKKPIDVIKGN